MHSQDPKKYTTVRNNSSTWHQSQHTPNQQPEKKEAKEMERENIRLPSLLDSQNHGIGVATPANFLNQTLYPNGIPEMRKTAVPGVYQTST